MEPRTNAAILICYIGSIKRSANQFSSSGRKIGLPPPPLGKNMRQAGHPVRPLRFHEQRVRRIHNLLASLRGYKSGPLSGTVLSLRASPVGQLLCPATSHVLILIRICTCSVPSSRTRFARFGQRGHSAAHNYFASLRRDMPQSTRCPIFVRHLPAAGRSSNDLASAVRRLRFA
jgi:hypothetical protein